MPIPFCQRKESTNLAIIKWYLIGASLSEPHHRRTVVKSVFLLACFIRYPLYGWKPFKSNSKLHQTCDCTNHSMWVCPSNANLKSFPHYMNIAFYIMTGFWKTNQIVTLGLLHFTGPDNSYVYSYTTHSQCDYQAWLTGLLFLGEFRQPCKFMMETVGPMEGNIWKA